MNRSKQYLKSFVDKIIMETLSEKADKVMGKLKNAPSSFDYVEDIDLGLDEATMEDKQGNVLKPGMSGMTNEDECNECGTMYEIELDEDETCECGGSIYEGECMECGMKSMGGEEILEFGSGKSDFTAGMFDEDFDPKDSEFDELNFNLSDYDDEPIRDEEDWNPNLPSDSEDIMSTGWDDLEEGETEEGNAFTGKLKKTPKGGSFKLGGKEYKDRSSLEETLYRLVDGDESALFTESEIIDIIENIVLEEKKKESNITKGVTPKGLETYNKAHKGSGKENKEYLESVAKKMTDYIKDGSKQKKYESNPKHFPKGNGELEKMEKRAYEVSEAGDEFIDDYLRPGMQTLDYDEMHPNEEWMDSIIQGSSKTGNSDEYANAEKTEVNKKLNNTRKKGEYNKVKRAAYNKAPQPVISDKPGQENGKGLHLKNESIDDKNIQKLNEEFNRMKNLISYDRKTQ